jgi:hypothetical protein
MGPNGSDALSGSSPEVPAVLISIDKSLESIRSQEKGTSDMRAVKVRDYLDFGNGYEKEELPS